MTLNLTTLTLIILKSLVTTTQIVRFATEFVFTHKSSYLLYT